MNLLRRAALLLAAIPLIALIGCEPADPSAPKQAFRGVDITGADYARSLSLPDQNGQLRSLADFKGKVVVVFFGYTQCPDVCPTTMLELAQVKKELGAAGERDRKSVV